MDSDNDSYNSENEFYYPDEQNVLQENKNKLKMAAVKFQFKYCLQSTRAVLKTSGIVFPNTDLPAGK